MSGKLSRMMSLVSRGAKYHLTVAITLTTIIPLLCFAFLVWSNFWYAGTASFWSSLVVSFMALLVALLGYWMLRRYPINIVKLREYLKSMVDGELPQRVVLDETEDDISAIESYMNTVLEQMRHRIQTLEDQLAISRRMQKTIEVQAEDLVDAERHRVMIESLGAACHHIGQPATVLRLYMDFLREDAISQEATDKLAKCEEALDSIAEVLSKLQRISQYRTVPYETHCVETDKNADRILDIEQ
ncbi:MAG: hypothetical protein QGI24_05060 [Kiritimatiellia bacterium]|nr:hypothetical protein [Kiritimatiellia bacterium]MDP6848137.1 hypothetical protein [Kiritimatiellia bacterium]